MRWEQAARYAILSDLGLRRQNNEDSATVRLAADRDEFHRSGHLFLVADGMGGHAVGELASRMATETIPLTYAKTRHDDPSLALREAITAANTAIHTKGDANRDFARMGTTCTSLALTARGAIVGHVGDSRCYRIRRGRIDQLSFDHSLQWELIRRGGLKPDAVMQHEPRNVITRSLGPEASVEVDVEGPFTVLPRDVYLLCSDGLTNHVADEELGAIAGSLPPTEAARLLVHLALSRGGNDNVTVVVVAVGDVPEGLGLAPVPDPTEPPNYLLIALGWLIAGVLVFGVTLLILGRLEAGVWTCAISIAALMGVVFRIWQTWYRRPREKPLHGDETTHWRPYRSASAHLDEAMFSKLAKLEADLERSAHEEHWGVKSARMVKLREHAIAEWKAGRRVAALKSRADAIDLLMRGYLRHRRPATDVGDDFAPEIPPDEPA